MLRKAALSAAAFLSFAAALPVAAQSPEMLVERYTPLAGSESQAHELITGLREDQNMGYGTIDNALALTKASLEKQGIFGPTPQQLQGALDEVLAMRAQGMGWGQIANSMGFRLGELKRPEHAGPRVARVVRPEKPERPVKPERPMRPERPERPVRAGK